MAKDQLCIFTRPEDLDEGLFGGVFLFVFEALPHLFARGIYPRWDIRANRYGMGPDQRTIPGVLDLAYVPPAGPSNRISLREFRRRHAHALGGDFAGQKKIWDAYFKVPAHIEERAKEVLPGGRILGLHYRGNDKLTNGWDSNTISHEQFLRLAADFMSNRPPFDLIFAATDDYAFIAKLQEFSPVPVLNLGDTGGFHKAEVETVPLHDKTERAMLDCVLLSRCTALIQTSSALPSFAKLLNPDIEMYRTASSKLFSDLPYWPVAYIPVFPTADAECQAILDSTMKHDWTAQPGAERFKQPFVSRIRRLPHHIAFSILELFGK